MLIAGLKENISSQNKHDSDDNQVLILYKEEELGKS